METAITAKFADGEYRFWLPLPQVFELERSVGSLLAVEERLRPGLVQTDDGDLAFLGGGSATVKEIRETIRLGLIGGNSAMIDGEEIGVGPIRAKELLDTYVYPERPLGESAALAFSILSAAIRGIEVKKKSEPEEPESMSPSEKDS